MFEYLSEDIVQLAGALQFSFGGKVFTFFTSGKTQLNLNYEVSALLVRLLFSLSYGNITLLESDHDIVRYQVNDLIS